MRGLPKPHAAGRTGRRPEQGKQGRLQQKKAGAKQRDLLPLLFSTPTNMDRGTYGRASPWGELEFDWLATWRSRTTRDQPKAENCRALGDWGLTEGVHLMRLVDHRGLHSLRGIDGLGDISDTSGLGARLGRGVLWVRHGF